jgi:hypothetical protein
VSKNNKKRRDAKARKAKRMHTTLGEHRSVKKTLVPPLNRLPVEQKFSRWVDERLPEMLWACLVRSVLSRDEALEVFRRVARIATEFIDSEAALSEIIPTHSNLAGRYPELIPRIIQVVGNIRSATLRYGHSSRLSHCPVESAGSQPSVWSPILRSSTC